MAVEDAPELPELVPARMLNEFAYCPRLMYLEWVQGEWADNPDTEAGRIVHRRVDQESGKLAEPKHADEEAEPEHADEEAELLISRSVMLSSEQHGLIAKIDLIEQEGGRVQPVDYKKSRKPKRPRGNVWEPEKVQLCAQGLILRDNGFECAAGVIYFAGSRDRVTVEFTEELVGRTLELLLQLNATVASGTIPPPLVDSPKCPRCSLVGICLPDELNRLSTASEKQVRRLVMPRNEARPLYVDSQGYKIGKSGECLVIKKRGEKVGEARLIHTSQVVLFGNVQISTQAIRVLAKRDIPVLHMSYGGWFQAVTRGLSHKNIELRMRQFERATDPDFCLDIARQLVRGKILNSRTLLRRNASASPVFVLSQLEALAKRAEEAADMPKLLGLEGMAAKHYFSRFTRMLKPPDAGGFEFEKRNRRPPTDPVNALLSLGYSLLTKDCYAAVLSIGFDPFLGFYHQPRYGRPALALDLMEEFRPLIVDSTVIRVINTGEIEQKDFIKRGPAVSLRPHARKKYIGAYERRMAKEVKHPIFGYRVSYRQLLAIQARLLGRVLTEEIPGYPPFMTR